MIKRLPFFIAIRHIRGKQDTGFATFISWLSYIAMSLGVAILIVVLSVMNGFNGEIRHRILQVVPHVLVESQQGQQLLENIDSLNQVKGVEGLSPLVQRFAMLSHAKNNRGSLIRGIDPVFDRQVNQIAQNIKEGDFNSLRAGEYGIVLGGILARSLGVSVGDRVLLSLPQLNVTPAGVFPRFKRFRVVGIYSVGAQVDDAIALIHISDAQKVFRLGDKVDTLQIKIDQPLNPDQTMEKITKVLGEGYLVSSWQDKMQSLFAAIKLEKLVVGVLLSSIIFVATFNIIASLVLMVASKRKDIAVLRTLGADLPVIYRVIVYQGSLLGIGGVVTGTLLGVLLAANVGGIVSFFENLFGVYLFDPSIYFINGLPSEVLMMDVALVAIVGVILSISATLYPAYRAGQVLPAEALRYDH